MFTPKRNIEIDDLLATNSAEIKGKLANWRENGRFPRQIVNTLLKVLSIYFDSGATDLTPLNIEDHPSLAEELVQLDFELKSVEKSDAKFLYAHYVKPDGARNGAKIYIASILQRLLAGNFSKIHKDLELLVRFLAHYDPSYIVDSKNVLHIYEEEYLGPSFDFPHFKRECLPRLVKSAGSVTVRRKLEDFSKQVEQVELMLPEHVDSLAKIYACRWNLVKDTTLCYLREHQDVSSPADSDCWLFMAKYLRGAGLLPSGEYLFIMPSLVHTSDEPLEDYHLTDYILSRDGTSLINLAISRECYERDKDQVESLNRDKLRSADEKEEQSIPFCVQGQHARSFTGDERDRIAFSAKKYRHYVEILAQKPERPVKLSTLLHLYHLLTETILENISEEQITFAYLKFCEAINGLDLDEQQKFYDLRINWRGRNYSVHKVLSQIAKGDFLREGCTTSWRPYLLKCLLDHFPQIELTRFIRLEHSVAIMQEESAKKVTSEDGVLCIDPDMIRRRNESLMLSLLMLNPHCSTLSDRFNFEDIPFICDSSVSPYFTLFKRCIEDGDSAKTDIYAKVMSSDVLPHLVQGSLRTLPEQLRNWFTRILGSDFLCNNYPLFDPMSIYFAAVQIVGDAEIREYSERFIRSIVNMLVSSKTDSVKRVFINFKFNQYLQLFSVEEQARITRQLREVSTADPINLGPGFYESVYGYLKASKSYRYSSGQTRDVFFTSLTSNTSGSRATSASAIIDWKQITSLDEVMRMFEQRGSCAVNLVDASCRI
jgi:hypothetical protein